MSYKQLTYELRCQIYVLKKSNMSQQDIGAMIGVSQSDGADRRLVTQHPSRAHTHH